MNIFDVTALILVFLLAVAVARSLLLSRVWTRSVILTNAGDRSPVRIQGLVVSLAAAALWLFQVLSEDGSEIPAPSETVLWLLAFSGSVYLGGKAAPDAIGNAFESIGSLLSKR